MSVVGERAGLLPGGQVSTALWTSPSHEWPGLNYGTKRAVLATPFNPTTSSERPVPRLAIFHKVRGEVNYIVTKTFLFQKPGRSAVDAPHALEKRRVVLAARLRKIGP